MFTTTTRLGSRSFLLPPAALFLLLLFFCNHRPISAFATYMLSGGGCYIELDPSEVIMNYYVKPVVAEAPLELVVSSPTSMALPAGLTLLASSSTSTQPQIILTDAAVTAFPVTVEFKVLPTPPSPSGDTANKAGYGYEYVLQIVQGESDNNGENSDNNVIASFADGACEGDQRVAGRSFDTTIQMTLTQAPAPGQPVSVQAAWAEGHEAVKLLRGLQFVDAATYRDETDDETEAPKEPAHVPEIRNEQEEL